MNSKSLLTKICLILGIVFLVIFGIAAIVSSIPLLGNGNEYESFLSLVATGLFAGLGVISGGFYLILFAIANSKEKKNDLNNTFMKIRLLLMLLPVIIIVIGLLIFNKMDSKREYLYEDVSITFPKEYRRLSEGDTSNYVEFASESKDNKVCMILFRQQELVYDDFMKMYQETVNRNERIEKEYIYNIIKDIKFSDLKSEFINGKEWKYYEKENDILIYKRYALKYNNNFYIIEVNNHGKQDSCNRDIGNILKTIEYK